jgi:glycosyltransferase involved in cell wall biosynthesis
MLSYAWRAFWVAKSLKEKPHLIIGVTVHPFAALAAYILAVLKRTPFIFEVRDLWPLTLIEFGRLSEHSPIAWAMSALEWFLCHRAAKIITTVPGGGEYFKERGVPRDKTVWIPNGLDLSRYSNMKRYDGNVSLPFTVMYVGGHVYAFALDVILRAAQLNNGSGGSGVQFVFVGGGQEKPNLIRLSQDLGVDNVEFRDVVPKNDLYKVMEQADAFVLCMRDRPRLYKYGVSFNKLCDYLACGRPVIFAGSPFYNPIADARAGIVIPPENPRELAAAIRMLADLNPEERVRMGQNGQQYVKEHHDINILTEKLESVLKSVAEVPEGRASNQTT